MKTLKSILCLTLSALLLLSVLSIAGCTGGGEQIIIYTSAEDYRNEYLQQRLEQEFPEYTIILEYKDTGSHAATLLAEGTDTACDITYDLEYGYMEQLARAGVLASLSGYDQSLYTPDTRNEFYLPTYRNGGAVIVNPTVLAAKGLESPKSYEDLLKPEYKGLISMPNPKSSGTGYMTLKALVNSMGEAEAFAYFDKLSENILSFTSSGSGPVNALKNQEVAIGLGMTGQAVMAINEGATLEVLYFEGGSPYCMYGQGIISGKEERESVKRVFDFLVNTFMKENNEKFFPEQIFNDFVPTVENYPENIVYADMSGNTPEEKDRLLDKWAH